MYICNRNKSIVWVPPYGATITAEGVAIPCSNDGSHDIVMRYLDGNMHHLNVISSYLTEAEAKVDMEKIAHGLESGANIVWLTDEPADPFTEEDTYEYVEADPTITVGSQWVSDRNSTVVVTVVECANDKGINYMRNTPNPSGALGGVVSKAAFLECYKPVVIETGQIWSTDFGTPTVVTRVTDGDVYWYREYNDLIAGRHDIASFPYKYKFTGRSLEQAPEEPSVEVGSYWWHNKRPNRVVRVVRKSETVVWYKGQEDLHELSFGFEAFHLVFTRLILPVKGDVWANIKDPSDTVVIDAVSPEGRMLNFTDTRNRNALVSAEEFYKEFTKKED